MRQMRMCLTFAAAAVAAVSLGAGKVPKQWQSTYRNIAKMIEHKDVKAFMTTCDKSFVSVFNGKKTGYDEYAKGFAEFMVPFDKVKVKLVASNYREEGGNFKLDFNYQFDGWVKTKEGGRKEVRFFQAGTDTWQKFGESYLEVLEEVKKQGVLPVETKKA